MPQCMCMLDEHGKIVTYNTFCPVIHWDQPIPCICEPGKFNRDCTALHDENRSVPLQREVVNR